MRGWDETQFFYLNLHIQKFKSKMKRNIIFASALALCMGLSFTSCLDSNNDSDTSYVGGFVKVTSNYMGLGSFKGPDGKTTINPTLRYL